MASAEGHAPCGWRPLNPEDAEVSFLGRGDLNAGGKWSDPLNAQGGRNSQLVLHVGIATGESVSTTDRP